MSDKYTRWKITEVGENTYLSSHINLFWLASADGITSPFFMDWQFYVDWKEGLYHGYYTYCYSWEFCGNTTGLLLPETSL